MSYDGQYHSSLQYIPSNWKSIQFFCFKTSQPQSLIRGKKLQKLETLKHAILYIVFVNVGWLHAIQRLEHIIKLSIDTIPLLLT